MSERPLSEEIDAVMHRPGAKLNSVHVFARVRDLEAEIARLRKVMGDVASELSMHADGRDIAPILNDLAARLDEACDVRGTTERGKVEK